MTRRQYVPVGLMRQGRQAEQRMFAHWLVQVGYPFDFHWAGDDVPPVDHDLIAKAWHDLGPSATVDEWRDAIRGELGV